MPPVIGTKLPFIFNETITTDGKEIEIIQEEIETKMIKKQLSIVMEKEPSVVSEAHATVSPTAVVKADALNDDS